MGGDGMVAGGAKRMCLLPAVAIGDKEVAAELWFIRGEQAYSTIEWQPPDVGEDMAKEAVQGWTGVEFEGASICSPTRSRCT